MSLATVPLDVILELTFFLDLQDSLHLLSTSTSLQSLLSLKDFWLKTLGRMEKVHMQPLPCPFGVDIADMPTEGLRKLAIHAYSLKRNWSLARAIPASIRKFKLGGDYREICVIPGTNLVITNSHERLVCWHTISGARLGGIEHDDDAAYLIGRAPPFQLLGQCFIGLSSQNRPHLALLVVKIDYQNADQVIVSETYSTILSTAEFRPISIPDVALDENVIGMVFTSHIDQLSTLVYCHFNDGIVHRVPLGIRLGTLPVCALHGGHFYIHGQDLREPAMIVRVPVAPPHSPDTVNHAIEITPIDVPASVPESQLSCLSIGLPQLLPPKYGVFNITRRTSHSLRNRPPARLPSVHFWPATDSGAHLDFGELSFYEHHSEIVGLAAGVSGRYAAIIDVAQRASAMKPKTGLGLVHYAPHPVPHTSFHVLDIASVDINFYTAVLALDDVLGVVYVTHIGEGDAATFSVLSYA
ncbi:hypothetical protein B0H17DRAFT_1338793 [Mycena rosella]|uniref:F-box domain-containing protein n=1 Tax=Mycena rosella TaxID=1033263 RepID=A0AAD7CJA9_MYCRO|nr:hypothetical protein B0H17DRAFT_1338793 [Mycena rosella]